MRKWTFLIALLLAFLLVSACELFNSFLPKTLAPALTPAGGTYNSDQTVTLISDTPDAVIRYTTDGSTPGSEADTYHGPIAIAGDGTTVTIKAIAKAEGMQDSDLAEATYTIDYDSVPMPTISLAGGDYAADQDVEILQGAGSPAGTQIRYTTNGYAPTASSALYSGLIPVHGNGASVTIKAIATAAGFADSGVVSVSYTITYPQIPAMGITNAGGVFTAGTSTALSSTVSGATATYTLDGTDPRTSGTALTHSLPFTVTPIWVDPPTLLRAVADAPGYATSPETVAAYSSIPMVSVALPPVQIQESDGFFMVSAFTISKFEITQAQYIAVLTAEDGVAPTNPSSNKSGVDWLNRPVENITWFDAVEFCNKLNHYLYSRGMGGSATNAYTISSRAPASGHPITGATVTVNYASGGIRLPTEIEWEIASRTGNPDTANKWNASVGYPWGPTAGDWPTYAWLNAAATTYVGTLASTGGVYDIEGNVTEWVGDWIIFPEAPRPGGTNGNPVLDYRGPATGSFKVTKGGAAVSASPAAYTARSSMSPGTSHFLIGFRVAK
jgi:formylglycine-generating enzyme required for sulfatase activity